MNIICLGDFLITNKQGKTVFTFVLPPLYNSVDLYKKANEHNLLLKKRLHKQNRKKK